MGKSFKPIFELKDVSKEGKLPIDMFTAVLSNKESDSVNVWISMEDID